MAVRSRDFVGIAEGIKSHELSTKGKIEQTKGHISQLSGKKSSLESTISYLDAAIAAAYEDTDDEGEPDYSRIAALEAQRGNAEGELSGVEQELQSANGELQQSEAELAQVEEEKAQTLFEIQERARKTSQNSASAGQMIGSYSGVGSTLQSSLQASFSALSQAAGILGGSVDSAGTGGGAGGTSSLGGGASKGGSNGAGDVVVSGLSAFSGGGNNSSGSSAPSASQFSTGQAGKATPASLPNFHSGQVSINPQKTLNFSSDQVSNGYAAESFSGASDSAGKSGAFKTSQESSAAQSGLATGSSNPGGGNSATSKREQFLERIHYDVSGNFSPSSRKQPTGGSNGSGNTGEAREREIGEELERGLFSHSKNHAAPVGSQATTSGSRGKESTSFRDSLKVDSTPRPLNTTGSNNSGSSHGTINRVSHDHPVQLNDNDERGLFSSWREKSCSKQQAVVGGSSTATGGSHDKDVASFKERLKVKSSPQPQSSTGSNNSGSDDVAIDPLERDLSKELHGGEERGFLSGSRKTSSNAGFANNTSSPRNQILSGISKPRSISSTAQEWKRQSDGSYIYNTPIETGSKLDCHQGKYVKEHPGRNKEEFHGTCGLVSCENILRLAGVSITEATVVEYASSTTVEKRIPFLNGSTIRKTLCRTGSDPSQNGGTGAEDRKIILDHFGIPSRTAKQEITTIAKAVASGRGVIASIYPKKLYKNLPISKEIGSGMTHAITITSVKVDANGKVIGFYVCDSNAHSLVVYNQITEESGAMYYSAKELEEAFTDRECNITETIIR